MMVLTVAGPTTYNDVQFSLMVGLSSTVGGLVSLALLYYLARKLMKRHSDNKNQALQQSGVTIIKSNFDLSGLRAMKERANAGSDESDLTGAGISEHQSGKLDNTRRRGVVQEKDQTYFAVEFEDILQLMARTETNTSSFVDPHLRVELETRIDNSKELTFDHAALYQLMSKIELDSNSIAATLLTPDRINLLQKRVSEGPFNENHLLALKLLCEFEQISESQEASLNCGILAIQDLSRKSSPTFDGDSEITPVEEKALPADKSILDVLSVLKKCDLEPSFLSQKESRKFIEDKIINQPAPLLADHLAVLQILGKIEIDSDLSLQSERRTLLQKRIMEGPLNAEHLCAVQNLRNLQVDFGTEQKFKLVAQEKRAIDDLECSPRLADVLSQGQSTSEGTEPNNEGESENKSTFSVERISSLEIKSSLFNREEKNTLQLMELRAKTNRIRQSLPDWVRKGLVPPQCDALQANPIIHDNIALHADSESSADGQGGAVLISCDVRADLGYFTDFVTPAVQSTTAKSQREILESVLFLQEHASADLGFLTDSVTPAAKPTAILQQEILETAFLRQEQHVQADLGFLTDAVTPAVMGPEIYSTDNLQQEVLEGIISNQQQNVNISEEPVIARTAVPYEISASIAWLARTISHCLASCLQAVLGLCFSRKEQVPRQGDPLDPEPGAERRE